ncbi:MAG: HEAT repeat domain-containing protein [Methanomicrobiaceae archaeon]|nr:HEAT repeat domain-containing protein [Methanomicrobiaceae archaeon]
MHVTGLDNFLAALRDPAKSRRAEAVAELVATGPPAVEGLLPLLKDPSWVVRYRCCEALGLIGDPRGAVPLREALEDEKDHVRYMAAKALGQLMDRDSLPFLVARLDDENACVRKSAAVALGALGTRGASLLLERALRKETSRQVRGVMESVLATLNAR